MSTQRMPEALILMGRDEFEAQFDPTRLERLRTLARLPEPIWTDELDSAAIRPRLAGVEVLLTGWGAPLLDAERLARMPRLQAMIHCAGTIRPMVSDAFWARGIRASNVAEANAIPVAEYTLAAVIMAGKAAPFLARGLRERRDDWADLERFGRLGNLGRTVGVVGFSRVGRRVVAALQQLEDITVLVHDPYADPAEVAAAGGRLTDLPELLPQVDILSLHVPALPETRHLIGPRELAALPDHATLINTARGMVVDTSALEAECVSGRLNAVLDVTEPEPLPAASVLYDLPNVVITPHIAGSLGTELYRMTDAALDELERLASGLPMLNEISIDDLRLSA
ncbi:hydroxyacid dehydrogenase [Gryllotalpicola ginsengisoli]|uniref:hydroxyacid dehydrogenase n=1 Tax=Gryllotalpicola ginsengisoli TaxID=444608 RepID=UPI0003B69AF3|nr:hydroxyacid dehydrogenase [Gryllotalpicola ginsengisoli]